MLVSYSPYSYQYLNKFLGSLDIVKKHALYGGHLCPSGYYLALVPKALDTFFKILYGLVCSFIHVATLVTLDRTVLIYKLYDTKKTTYKYISIKPV
jgi:hypothetical protein